VSVKEHHYRPAWDSGYTDRRLEEIRQHQLAIAEEARARKAAKKQRRVLDVRAERRSAA
jgi:hypothetical protein